MKYAAAVAAACWFCAPSAPLAAQQPDTLVAAGAQYGAGTFMRLFAGRWYRQLWTTPIRAELVDLRGVAGGLSPTTPGGGFQTRSLRFAGADGRQFGFRSVDKDPAAVLPERLRTSLAADLVRDQTSAQHPAGPVIAAALMAELGIPHLPLRLVALPDDPLLGEHRRAFAGLLGTFEDRTLVAGAGASVPISTDSLARLLAHHPAERVDATAFLYARLFDVFIGDWDRHKGQWTWTRGDDGRWLPLPEDRDMAFAKYDGLGLTLVRYAAPQMTNFGPRYASIHGQTWNGRDLDRQFLNQLELPVWDSVAAVLQSRLSDAVIERAVAAQPPEYDALSGELLRESMRARREALPGEARRYYLYLAEAVDVHGTHRADTAVATWSDDGSLTLTVSSGGATLFRRTFRRHETREVRLYLRGGDDHVLLRGGGGILLRVIGGPGRDAVEGSAASLRLYDEDGLTGGGRRVDPRPFVWDSSRDQGVPPRDWGRWVRTLPAAGYAPEVGVLVGEGVSVESYGFRREPWASRSSATALFASAPRRFRAALEHRRRMENRAGGTVLRLRYSGLDILRFYGFGNNTAADQAASFYKVEQARIGIDFQVQKDLGKRVTAFTGPELAYASTRTGGLVTPGLYGAGDFRWVGWHAGLELDTRDLPAAAARGVHLRLESSGYPGLWDVASAFATHRLEAATYLSARPGVPATLALRAGARRTSGRYPFFLASYVGGPETLRGWTRERFAGDHAAWASAELRLTLGEHRIAIPGEWGAFGLADAGRVVYQRRSPGGWHPAFGGGLWMNVFLPAYMLSVAVAGSEERTAVYFRGGFAF